MSIEYINSNNHYSKFEVNNSQLNKHLLPYDLSQATVIYSNDNKYSIVYTKNYLLVINNEKNEIRSRQTLSKDESFVKVKLAEGNVTFLVQTKNPDYVCYIGVLALENLGDYFEKKLKDNFIDFYYVDAIKDECDKLILINSQFDICYYFNGFVESNMLNLIRQSSFYITNEFKIVNIEYEFSSKYFYIFLESGEIFPIKINRHEDNESITYIENSYLHISSNKSSYSPSLSNKSQSIKSKSVSTSNSISVVSSKKSKIKIKIVKMSNIEFALPYFPEIKSSHSQNLMNIDEENEILEKFKIILIIYEEQGSQYLSIIKFNKNTSDLIPLKYYELSNLIVFDVHISNCFNTSLLINDRKDTITLFLLVKYNNKPYLELLKENLLDTLLSKTLKLDNSVVSNIFEDKNTITKILNVIPKNIFSNNPQKQNEIEFDIILRSFYLNSNNSNNSKGSFIKDHIFSEEKKPEESDEESSLYNNILISENPFEQIEYFNNLNKKLSSFYDSYHALNVIKLIFNNKVISKLKDQYENINEIFHSSDDNISSSYSDLNYISNELSKQGNVDYYLLFLLSCSSNFYNQNALHYVTLKVQNEKIISILQIYESVQLFIKLIKNNICNDYNHTPIKKFISDLKAIINVMNITQETIVNNHFKLTEKERIYDKETLIKFTEIRNKIERLLISASFYQFDFDPHIIDTSLSNFNMLNLICNNNYKMIITKEFILDNIRNESSTPSLFQFFLILYCHLAESLYDKLNQTQKDNLIMNFPLLNGDLYPELSHYFKKYGHICNLVFNIDKYYSVKGSIHKLKSNELSLKLAFNKLITFIVDPTNLDLFPTVINIQQELLERQIAELASSDNRIKELNKLLECILQVLIKNKLFSEAKFLLDHAKGDEFSKVKHEYLLQIHINNRLYINALELLRKGLVKDIMYIDIFNFACENGDFKLLFQYLSLEEEKYLVDNIKKMKLEEKEKVMSLLNRHYSNSNVQNKQESKLLTNNFKLNNLFNSNKQNQSKDNTQFIHLYKPY